MSREGLYSIIIELPKEQESYLREISGMIGNRLGIEPNKEEFHLTIEPTLYCSDNGFRTNLCQWLESQDPFELTLDRTDWMETRRGDVLMLTVKDDDEKAKIEDLHQGIHETINSRNPIKQNDKFIPHVTLFSAVPLEKKEWLEYKMEKKYEPITIPVTEVIVRKKIDDYQWKDFGKFRLGLDCWSNESMRSAMSQVKS